MIKESHQKIRNGKLQWRGQKTWIQTTQFSQNSSQGNDERALDVLLSYDNSMPLDLTIEILLRLPAKSLLRFHCVSKQWLSITAQPYFIKSFAIHARPSLLLSFKKKDKRLFFSLPQHEIPDEKCLFSDHVSNYRINLPRRDENIFISESINGLIFFHPHRFFMSVVDHITIWNPSLRQHVTLPNPKYKSKTYLGYDPIGDTYKLLCMPYYGVQMRGCKVPGYGYVPKVLTLGVKEPWRVTKESPTYCSTLTSWKCIDGVIYYEMFIQNSDRSCKMHSKIMSFNVRYENFKPIQLPCCTGRIPGKYHSLLNYHGRLALVCSPIKLWILENAVEEKWSCKDLPFCLANDSYLASDVTFTDDFIIYLMRVSSSLSHDLFVVYYDLKKKSHTPFKIEKIEDEEFQLHGGSYSGEREFLKFTWCCSSNHNECLVPLENISCSSLV